MRTQIATILTLIATSTTCAQIIKSNVFTRGNDVHAWRSALDLASHVEMWPSMEIWETNSHISVRMPLSATNNFRFAFKREDSARSFEPDFINDYSVSLSAARYSTNATTEWRTIDDDTAPTYTTQFQYEGHGHGMIFQKWTKSTHGLTEADLGKTWQYNYGGGLMLWFALWKIDDENIVTFATRPYTVGTTNRIVYPKLASAVTLTAATDTDIFSDGSNVSSTPGAADITGGTGSASDQYYPVSTNVVTTLTVDGVTMSPDSTTSGRVVELVCDRDYRDWSYLYARVAASVGVQVNLTDVTETWAHRKETINIYGWGQVRHTDILTIEATNNIVLSKSGPLQGLIQWLVPVSSNRFLWLPDTTGLSPDYSVPTPWTNGLHVPVANWGTASKPPSFVVEIGNTNGTGTVDASDFSFGYLLGYDPTEDNTSFTSRALQIPAGDALETSTAKVWLYAFQQYPVTAGATLTTHGSRIWYSRPAELLSLKCWAYYDDHWILYLGWPTALDYSTITLPDYLAGKLANVVHSSSGVTCATSTTHAGIAGNWSGSNGWAIIRLEQ